MVPKTHTLLALPQHWPEVERLFGENGACGGCWCMMWRLKKAKYESNKGASNRNSLKRLITGGHAPGVLRFENNRAVAWAALGHRSEFARLAGSRILAPVSQETGVWSIPCIFIQRSHRRQGVGATILRDAASIAFQKGAAVVEGYPFELPAGQRLPDAFIWTGVQSSFLRAGYSEVARRSARRPIMQIRP